MAESYGSSWIAPASGERMVDAALEKGVENGRVITPRGNVVFQKRDEGWFITGISHHNIIVARDSVAHEVAVRAAIGFSGRDILAVWEVVGDEGSIPVRAFDGECARRMAARVFNFDHPRLAPRDEEDYEVLGMLKAPIVEEEMRVFAQRWYEERYGAADREVNELARQRELV